MKNITFYVPFFNSSLNLIKVLTAISQQTYPFEEIVLVNDGSTDNSREFAETFIKNNSELRIRIIDHKKTLELGLHEIPHLMIAIQNISLLSTHIHR